MNEIKIGQVLKRLLKDKRISLKKISVDTGIPYSTLHTWQENRQPKDILKAKALADYFGISLHQLLFDKKDMGEKEFQGMLPPISEIFRGTFEITIRRLE